MTLLISKSDMQLCFLEMYIPYTLGESLLLIPQIVEFGNLSTGEYIHEYRKGKVTKIIEEKKGNKFKTTSATIHNEQYLMGHCGKKYISSMFILC